MCKINRESTVSMKEIVKPALWLFVLGCTWAGGALATTCEVKKNSNRADLQGCDLSGQHLEKFNFSHANLTGANLSGAFLKGANLSHSNLTNVCAEGADLTHANLNHAIASCASFTNSILVKTNTKHITLGSNCSNPCALPLVTIAESTANTNLEPLGLQYPNSWYQTFQSNVNGAKISSLTLQLGVIGTAGDFLVEIRKLSGDLIASATVTVTSSNADNSLVIPLVSSLTLNSTDIYKIILIGGSAILNITASTSNIYTDGSFNLVSTWDLLFKLEGTL